MLVLQPFRCVMVLRPLLGVVGQASPANELGGHAFLKRDGFWVWLLTYKNEANTSGVDVDDRSAVFVDDPVPVIGHGGVGPLE